MKVLPFRGIVNKQLNEWLRGSSANTSPLRETTHQRLVLAPLCSNHYSPSSSIGSVFQPRGGFSDDGRFVAIIDHDIDACGNTGALVKNIILRVFFVFLEPGMIGM